MEPTREAGLVSRRGGYMCPPNCPDENTEKWENTQVLPYENRKPSPHHSGGSRNPFLRLLPFFRVLAHPWGRKRRRVFTRIRKWIPASAGMTANNGPCAATGAGRPRGAAPTRVRIVTFGFCRDRPLCLSEVAWNARPYYRSRRNFCTASSLTSTPRPGPSGTLTTPSFATKPVTMSSSCQAGALPDSL